MCGIKYIECPDGHSLSYLVSVKHVDSHVNDVPNSVVERLSEIRRMLILVEQGCLSHGQTSSRIDNRYTVLVLWMEATMRGNTMRVCDVTM